MMIIPLAKAAEKKKRDDEEKKRKGNIIDSLTAVYSFLNECFCFVAMQPDEEDKKKRELEEKKRKGTLCE